jgi:hypothetical protein
VSLEVRFWSKVRKLDGCWEWTGYRTKNGYGKIGLGERSKGVGSAHRVSWCIHYGQIPEGLIVMHRCDNPGCVNPEHLLLGTQYNNLADMRLKDRQARGEKVPQHVLTEAQVAEIKILLAQGRTQQFIADMFGVARWTIGKIAGGLSWVRVSQGDSNRLF